MENTFCPQTKGVSLLNLVGNFHAKHMKFALLPISANVMQKLR